MGKQVKKSSKPCYTQLRDSAYNQMLPVWTYGGQYHNTPVGMPSEVQIFGQKYRIFYHSKIYADRKKDTRLLGIVIFNHRMIFIEPGQTIHLMRESLYHEIAHVYTKVWQTKSEALSKLTYQQIEGVCDLFGEAIPDLVGNNTVTA